MVGAGDRLRTLVRRSAGGYEQQLVNIEVPNHCARNFDVTIMYWIKSPSICGYASFAHRLRFLILSFPPYDLVAELNTRYCWLGYAPHLLNNLAHPGDQFIDTEAGHRRNLKHPKSALVAESSKTLNALRVIDSVHLGR